MWLYTTRSVCIHPESVRYREQLGTENKTRKCPLPSDTMDRIAKEPKEGSEENQRYVDNFS